MCRLSLLKNSVLRLVPEVMSNDAVNFSDTIHKQNDLISCHLNIQRASLSYPSVDFSSGSQITQEFSLARCRVVAQIQLSH